MKFKVHRKRPDLTTVEIDADGAPLTVTIVKPNTAQSLKVTQTLMSLWRACNVKAGTIDAAEYAKATVAVFEFVKDIDGLEDEDGEAIAFVELNEDDRAEVALALPLDSILGIASAIGDLNDSAKAKKKRLLTTSSTSTPSAPADVPDAPED